MLARSKVHCMLTNAVKDTATQSVRSSEILTDVRGLQRLTLRWRNASETAMAAAGLQRLSSSTASASLGRSAASTASAQPLLSCDSIVSLRKRHNRRGGCSLQTGVSSPRCIAAAPCTWHARSRKD